MAKLRRPKPRQKELLLPFKISEKTKLFLPRSIGERMFADVEYIKQHHVDYQPLTTPSGIKLTGPSVLGKIISLMERYTRKTNFFLKEANEHELKFTQQINEHLHKKGLPVESFLEIYNEKGRHLMLVEKKGVSLFSISEQRPLTENEIRGWFHVLGVLNSLGIAHNHPHLNNFFRVKNQTGVFDFKLAKAKNIDWKNLSEIINFFSEDHTQIINIFLRHAIRNPEILQKVKERKADDILIELLNPLPIDPESKNTILRQMNTFLYNVLIPNLREAGYLRYKGIEL
ncbi:MAG: hypothetical protein HYW05_00610 [Candidatus Diapherotrites archaeon]|nr:hypothetical protein [Candidatus Diapherotrites archaeon]